MSKIEQLKNGMFQKKKELSEEDLIFMHHLLMRKYGWIPFEEFKKLPLPTFWDLIECIKQEREAEQREEDKLRSKRR